MRRLTISQAESPDDIGQLRELLLEYARGLDFHICFQQFETELAGLLGEYAPPAGRALLARSQASLAGGVALRRISHDICELKRLYVRPAFRGEGIGRQLVRTALEEARKIGYARICLDTLPSVMKEANALYRSLGFVAIQPAGAVSTDEVIDMELRL